MNDKCPKCGNKLSLNVITNTLDCSNCGYQIEENKKETKDNKEISEELKIEEVKKDNKYNLYHCNTCDVSFYGENIDNCFICGNSLENNSSSLDYSKYLEFKLDRGDALNKYHKKLLIRLICPISFRKKKTLKRLKGVYLPMHMFDTTIDGDVVFDASDVNVLDASKKEKKVNNFNVVCNGHFDYENVLINESSKFNNSIIEKIDDYNYDELKDIKELQLGENVIYKEDCDNYNVFERLKNRCVNNSVKLMTDLVQHSKSKVKDNKLDFKYDDKGTILVPVYILVNEYKNKKYYFVMNGQNGNSYIKTPIGIVEAIVFSVLLFTILFVIMLLIAIFI